MRRFLFQTANWIVNWLQCLHVFVLSLLYSKRHIINPFVLWLHTCSSCKGGGQNNGCAICEWSGQREIKMETEMVWVSGMQISLAQYEEVFAIVKEKYDCKQRFRHTQICILIPKASQQFQQVYVNHWSQTEMNTWVISYAFTLYMTHFTIVLWHICAYALKHAALFTCVLFH